jgi:hypothetical protein
MAGGRIHRRLYRWRRSVLPGSQVVLITIPPPLADRPDRHRTWLWWPR